MVWKVWNILDLKFGTLYYRILETLETLKNLRVKLSVGLLKIVLVIYVLNKSITLYQLAIFLELAIQRCSSKYRVPNLAGDLTMAASALKWFSIDYFYAFLLKCFWKKKCRKKMFYNCKFNVFNPFVPISLWINWGVNSLFL